MAAQITKLEPVTEDMTWTTTPYELEIKGEKERRVTIYKILDPENGKTLIRIVALATEGVPAQSLSMLDHIARTINPKAKVQAYNKAPARVIREYATA